MEDNKQWFIGAKICWQRKFGKFESKNAQIINRNIGAFNKIERFNKAAFIKRDGCRALCSLANTEWWSPESAYFLA